MRIGSAALNALRVLHVKQLSLKLQTNLLCPLCSLWLIIRLLAVDLVRTLKAEADP